VVRESEVVDRLPAEPHDRRVTHVLTAGGGLVRLGTE
jgi:5-formyltetrahydrofolate cyclo-ligase